VAGKHLLVWKTRLGVVYRSNDHAVFVVWEVTRTPEQSPIKAVKKAISATADVASFLPQARQA
jgi:hypothetical protein